MKRKRPGGQRQRLAAAAAEDAPAKMQSVLACYLLQRMAWGLYSPQEVQKLASMAKTDIENSQRSPDPMADLDKLASAGTYGRYPNKCNSDLTKRVGTVPFAKPLLIKMPLAGPAGSVNETLQSVFSSTRDFRLHSREVSRYVVPKHPSRRGLLGSFLESCRPAPEYDR